MRRILGLIIVCFGLAFPALAQPDNATVETIGGKKYYVHIVEQGNTLYGIHTLYKTSVESILDANEGLDNSLSVGQRILIPIETSDENHYGTHTVMQGETLYGISKIYNCSVEDLIRLNDNLTDGISPGQKIVVPKAVAEKVPGEVIQSDPVVTQKEKPVESKYAVSVKDTIVLHTVLPHETMYAIAKRYMVSSDTIMVLNGMRNTRIKKGDILKIPVKNVNYKVLEKDLTTLIVQDTLVVTESLPVYKETYSVALFLPLMLDKNEREMNKPVKLGQVKEMYSTTKISFDFYQGFMLAADSLTKAGLNVDIYIYDTKRDTNVIGKIFKQPEFQSMDLVVGPLFRNTINYTAKLCAANQIRIVLPFNSNADVLYQNPFVYKGVASNMTLLDGTVDYLIEKHKNHNIIVIKPTAAADLALYERVRERFNQRIAETEGAYNTSIIEIPLGSSSGRDLNGIVRKDTTNIVIIPSTNPTFVSGAMGRINNVLNMNPYAKNFRIISFGLEEWNKFDDLDTKYRNRSYQHYASYRFLDYNSTEGIQFIKAFRGEYGTDPNVYSTQGFDYGMYFLSALKLYGTNFDSQIVNHKMVLMQNDFMFMQVQEGSGRENRRVSIVKYDNYQLIQMK